MKKLFIFLFLMSFLLIGETACNKVSEKCYYVDASHGNDENDGRSAERAWKSIEKVNETPLKPGEKVLFKRGDTFYGRLEISAQGQKENPICIQAYGEGEQKPCIVGRDSSMYAVRILNSDYVTLQDLEIVNRGSEPLPGRSGLKVECREYGVSQGITLRNLTVRDVNGSLVKSEGGGCGILIENKGDKVVSIFDGLTIEDCHILRCARNGIIWAANPNREAWYPSKHTLVRGNLIEGVPGDGIVPIDCDSTLIEYNVMRDCPDLLPDTEAAAGIWPWSCDNTVIQFNEVSDHKAPWDAQGFDSDWNCTNTLIQYNYSHDNYGGLVLVCNSGEASSSFNIGNRGTILRYNISIGDGIRPKLTRDGMFSPNIHIAGPVEHTLIERNIIHSNPKPSGDIDRTMIVSDSWGGYADDTSFRENIFYTAEPSRFNLTESTQNTFNGNYYVGNYEKLPEENTVKEATARYEELVLSIDPAGYGALQQLMNAKNIGGKTHYFVDKEAIEAFFEAF